MITGVMLIGEIGEPIANNVRYIMIERNYRDNEGKFIIDKIPCQHWAKATNNHFMTMKNGSLICIRGRLETAEGIGVCIIADYLEMLMPVR